MSDQVDGADGCAKGMSQEIDFFGQRRRRNMRRQEYASVFLKVCSQAFEPAKHCREPVAGQA